jgi:hypothetical protein
MLVFIRATGPTMNEIASNDAIARLFAAAADFPQYLSAARVNANRLHEIYQRLENIVCDGSNAVFYPGTRLLVFCEPYCADCVINLPLIARLAEASEDTELRVVSRDAHRAIADNFPGRGDVSRIPTVLLLDSTWQLLGYWSERSKADHEWMSRFTRSDPLPEITLEEGVPVGEFARWLECRFEAQLPVFYSHHWRGVREELRDLMIRDA